MGTFLRRFGSDFLLRMAVNTTLCSIAAFYLATVR